jgi:hypothetical protein
VHLATATALFALAVITALRAGPGARAATAAAS